VAGLTGNFKNPSTDYTNGIDFHLDWAASQFLTKQLQVGVVGYVYNQLSPDIGCAPQLCPFESRVIGVGPQIGFIFPVASMQAYLNLKAYWEFDNANRPDGWNAGDACFVAAASGCRIFTAADSDQRSTAQLTWRAVKNCAV
jgi:hypothetical protein